MRREKSEFNNEKNILVNLIINTEFCREVLPYINNEYFRSSYAKTIIVWVKDYFDVYEKAPAYQITDIFENEKDYIDPEISNQISSMLAHLSDISEIENHNTDYLVDSAIDFFEERHAHIQLEAAQHYLSKGQVDQAKEAMGKQLEIRSNNFEWVAFNDEDYVRTVVRRMVTQADLDEAFFAFNGRLGRFIGPIDRGWFIAFFAPAKRGKTTYMMATIVTAIMRGLNVVVLSLEMPIKQLFARYLLATTGQKPEAGDRDVMTPIMDCMLNQDGSCELEKRTGYGQIVSNDGEYQKYEDVPDWEICLACRGEHNFKPAAWKVPVPKPQIDEGAYVKKAMKFSKYFGKRCRAIHIPSKTATVTDLRTEVELLKQKENFIPDMIVIDYADLIKPDSNGEKRHQLDDIWEYLRSWGQEDLVTIVSASQTNRISADQLYLKDTHVAEDYSKAAKVDIAIGLCQNDMMKERGIMNINKVLHRHEEFVQSHVCCVLQELTHQQPDLDSEFVIM